MKKMFTLRGVSGCGKSSKVRELAMYIINMYNIKDHEIDFNAGDVKGALRVNKLKMGFVGAGDDLNCVQGADDLLAVHADIDIIINTCRTKGAGYRYIEANYNSGHGWLGKYIDVQKFIPSNPSLESIRDTEIINELKCWITGLEKL